MTRICAKSLSVPLLAAAALVTGAIFAPAQYRASSDLFNKTHPPSAAQLVTLIDGTLQPRFQQDAGVFGISRTYGVDVIGGHQSVLSVLDVPEMATTPPANNLFTTDVGREYIIGFFRFAKKPGKYVSDVDGQPSITDKRTRPVYQELAWQRTRQQMQTQKPMTRKAGDMGDVLQHDMDQGRLQKAVKAVCLNALPDVRQGRPCDVTRSGYLIAIRPIKAAKASCLHCHAGAKLNDALGAMVYTVRLDTAAPKLTVRAF